jgi:transcription antitermination factor NusG
MSILPTEPNWYAVQTRSNFEKLVATQLDAKGIESYCPAIEELRQWADRKKVIGRPVFPGYVFARFHDDPGERLAVQKANGAVRILGAANHIEPVPEREIESIRMLLSVGQPCFPLGFLPEGSWVRVARGPLRGIEGRLVRARNRHRLVLSVNLLAQSVATEVGLSDVELVRVRA